MTSAAVQRSPEQRADEINATIRSTVRGLRSARGAEVPDIAAYLGISKGALYGKLKGTAKFLGSELALIAIYFGVPVSDFYEGIVRVTPVPESSQETGRTIRRKARVSQRHLHPVPTPAGDRFPSSGPDGADVAQVRVA